MYYDDQNGGYDVSTMSVRLDAALEHRLKEAAKLTGEPLSAIVREAVRRRCDELLSDRVSHRWADYIGAFRSNGGTGVARRTGKAFTELLLENRKKRKR